MVWGAMSRCSKPHLKREERESDVTRGLNPAILDEAREEAREEALWKVLRVGTASLARVKWARRRRLGVVLSAGKIRGMESSTSNAAGNKGLPMVRAKTTPSPPLSASMRSSGSPPTRGEETETFQPSHLTLAR